MAKKDEKTNIDVWSKLDIAICDLIDEDIITSSFDHMTLANALYNTLKQISVFHEEKEIEQE